MKKLPSLDFFGLSWSIERTVEHVERTEDTPWRDYELVLKGWPSHLDSDITFLFLSDPIHHHIIMSTSVLGVNVCLPLLSTRLALVSLHSPSMYMKGYKASAKVLTKVILAQWTRIRLSLSSLFCVYKLLSAVMYVCCQVSTPLSQQPKSP